MVYYFASLISYKQERFLLLNEIYDKNIDKEEKEKLNRIIYKVVFDIRDSIELIDTNDKKIIKPILEN